MMEVENTRVPHQTMQCTLPIDSLYAAIQTFRNFLLGAKLSIQCVWYIVSVRHQVRCKQENKSKENKGRRQKNCYFA